MCQKRIEGSNPSVSAKTRSTSQSPGDTLQIRKSPKPPIVRKLSETDADNLPVPGKVVTENEQLRALVAELLPLAERFLIADGSPHPGWDAVYRAHRLLGLDPDQDDND